MIGSPTFHITLPRRKLLSLALSLALLQVALWSFTSISLAQANAAPTISNVAILTPSVAQFEKFEAAFDVTTVSPHLDLPYDAKPPPGLEAGMGVSVDALFSSDNWQTTITQPAFFYQPYAYARISNRDHLTPDGMPHWLVRFAPRSQGDWQFRLRVQDRSGTTIFPEQGALKFHVDSPQGGRYEGLRANPYTRHGFLRVSKNDPRYFEFDDGTPFTGLGYNGGSESVESVRNRYRDWQVNGLQFARVWMSGAGINGSQWTPWAYPNQPYANSLPATVLDPSEHFGDGDFSLRINYKFPCLFVDFWQGGIPVEPSSTYSLTVRAKVVTVGPKPNIENAGFTVIRDGWVGNNGCEALNTIPLTPYATRTSDWFTATTTLETGADETFLNYLYLALQNINKGTAFVDTLALVKTDDPAQVNLIRDGNANSHLYFDDLNAAEWDLLIEQAEQHGIYLKIVSDEKNEWIRNVIQKDGTIGQWNNNNFYAAPNTKVRWLDEAWWRYLIARWGYSTAIHSFEFVNEGDPYNGNHYNAVDAMARYFDEHDPSGHMVTTSFWHSFPNDEFWSNPRYSAVDYADIHAYLQTGWGADASFVPPANKEARPEYQFEGKDSFHIPATQTLRKTIHPRGITLKEQGEWTIQYWMKQENFRAKCRTGESGSSVRVLWVLDDKRKGIVPNNLKGENSDCSSPAGTFDWRKFTSQTDRDGKNIPITQRIVLTDTLPHEISISVQNSGGISGDAWIANVELISPSGVRTPILGEFDNTRFEDDTAWLTTAYSELWGAKSPVGGGEATRARRSRLQPRPGSGAK